MALFLLITYIVTLIFQIILFVISIRKKTKKILADIVLYCISFLISICSYIAISNKQT